MKVTVKKRLISPEKTSLNLVITKDGKRTIESLGLFIYNFPKNKLEQQENKKILELAEHLRAEKVIQVQDKRFGTQRQDFSNQNFLEYYAEKMEERRESSGNYGNWNSPQEGSINLEEVSKVIGLKEKSIYSKGSRLELPYITRSRPLMFSWVELKLWMKLGRPTVTETA